jgi:hypothetical protein
MTWHDQYDIEDGHKKCQSYENFFRYKKQSNEENKQQ